jgi:antitoxin (DNA-binding transcriptional repressor) of toxin-antitoxin stability system
MAVMQTFTSRAVQTHWGLVTEIAKREPVTVTHYGRPSFMIVPIDIGRVAVRLSIKSERLNTIQAEAAENPLPLRQSLGMLKFLQGARTAIRTRAEIDKALDADRDSWGT